MKRFIFVLLFATTLCWAMDQPDPEAGQLTLAQIQAFDPENPPELRDLTQAMQTLAQATQNQEDRLLEVEATNTIQNAALRAHNRRFFIGGIIVTFISIGIPYLFPPS